MSHDLLLYGVLMTCGLLTVAAVMHGVCRFLKLPFAVGLLLAGFALSFVAETSEAAGVLKTIGFSPEMIFYIFLPTLIFESAYHLNYRTFQGFFREIVGLATIGVLISVAVISSLLHFSFGWSWGGCLLFASLISATDPVAVLAIFKDLKAPKKLSTIVDGESLINDGTALVLFQFFLGLAVGSTLLLTPTALAWESFNLLKSLGLGVVVGFAFGTTFSMLIAKTSNKSVKLTLSLVLAHMAFLVAEGLLGVSGILATMTAGLIVGNFGRRKFHPDFNRSFSEIWTFLGFISNALVFILLGLKLGELNLLDFLPEITVGIIVTLILGRFSAVFGVLNLTNLLACPHNRLPISQQSVIAWGGIRGALAAAAVLLIPETVPLVHEIQAMTAGVILASFIFNATTINFLLRCWHITDLTKSENFQSQEARLIINEEVLSYLDTLQKKKHISSDIYKQLKTRYEAEHEAFVQAFKEAKDCLIDKQHELEKVLTHFALGIESQAYQELFTRQEINEDRLVVLQGSIHRQTERLERDILPRERKSSSKYAPEVPKDHWLSNLLKRLGFPNWGQQTLTYLRRKKIRSRLQHYRARRIASWRVIQEFERLQTGHPVFSDCSVTHKIIDRYATWNQNAEQKTAVIEAEFPDIVVPIRTAMAENSCLEKARQLEKEFFAKGLISEKIYAELDQELGAKQRKV